MNHSSSPTHRSLHAPLNPTKILQLSPTLTTPPYLSSIFIIFTPSSIPSLHLLLTFKTSIPHPTLCSSPPLHHPFTSTHVWPWGSTMSLHRHCFISFQLYSSHQPRWALWLPLQQETRSVPVLSLIISYINISSPVCLLLPCGSTQLKGILVLKAAWDPSLMWMSCKKSSQYTWLSSKCQMHSAKETIAKQTFDLQAVSWLIGSSQIVLLMPALNHGDDDKDDMYMCACTRAHTHTHKQTYTCMW